MGNNICACDEANSRAAVNPMSLARPQAITAIQRDDSRAKLMVPFPTKDDETDSPLRSKKEK